MTMNPIARGASRRIAGIGYLALTAAVMFTLAGIKRRTARAMDSPLEAEASMTFLDGCLCIGILTALGANILFGWWWADAVAALGIGMFAAREGFESLAADVRLPHTSLTVFDSVRTRYHAKSVASSAQWAPA